jgi:membrane associated rhomboid family serine protease
MQHGLRTGRPATHAHGDCVNKSREPIFNVPAVVVVVLAALALVHAARMFVLSDEADRILLWTFAFIPARYDSGVLGDLVLPGGVGAKVWTFVTYSFIHANLTHIGFNALWLLVFGSAVARRTGAGRFLAFCAVTSAAGALAHLVTHPGALNPVIGASGAISGMMGASCRFAFHPAGGRLPPLRAALRNRGVLGFVAVWFGLNLLTGLGSLPLLGDDQVVAWQAHVGGFVAGLLLMPLFDPAPATAEPESTA